jgi:hypothetical protein
MLPHSTALVAAEHCGRRLMGDGKGAAGGRVTQRRLRHQGTPCGFWCGGRARCGRLLDRSVGQQGLLQLIASPRVGLASLAGCYPTHLQKRKKLKQTLADRIKGLLGRKPGSPSRKDAVAADAIGDASEADDAQKQQRRRRRRRADGQRRKKRQGQLGTGQEL